MRKKPRKHGIILPADRIDLRPMTEADWEMLERWNNNPEVLWFSESDDVQSRPLEKVGFHVDQWVQLPPDANGERECDVVLSRNDWLEAAF